jgi:hypothetical protein
MEAVMAVKKAVSIDSVVEGAIQQSLHNFLAFEALELIKKNLGPGYKSVLEQLVIDHLVNAGLSAMQKPAKIESVPVPEPVKPPGPVVEKPKVVTPPLLDVFADEPPLKPPHLDMDDFIDNIGGGVKNDGE